MSTKPRRYPEAEANPNFPAIEKEIIAKWKREKTFEASVEKNKGKGKNYVFYDGPPFATGLPHPGHLLTGYVKDLVPRYQTMRGHVVERRFGWDCHGLPAELETEKQTGVSGRLEIIKYGIDKFNSTCEKAVLTFTQEWRDYVERQARWVSFEDEYKTMDVSYMESVIWAFKTLWDKGLIYEDYRVVPYSWAVQSPLSDFETKLDNSYRERLDPTLTVGFELEPVAGDKGKTRLLAWTTTPWTLPSNLALCVNPEFDYAIMERGEDRWILAASTLEKHAKVLEGFTQTGTLKGSDLMGRRYIPLFPYFTEKKAEGAFVVLGADFVTAEDGTGTVHIAPGFGQEDFDLCKKHKLPIVVPVDAMGKFTADVPDYKGMNVIHEANAQIIKDLKAKGSVVLHEQHRHDYPHCWRTDEPLIYMAVSSWYVRVEKIRDRMVELNQGIDWVPSRIRDGIFGKWLANARDWNISRNRFWGSPLPVWKSDDPAYPRIDVYGSIAELERDFGVKVDNLHRPAIDNLVRANPDDPTGKSKMRRIEEVLDCWFDSGSMPFAQQHYPFENKEKFEKNFPGDFIVEYVAQTRGWFYLLMVLSTALFDRAPFRNCICHGVILGDGGQKLSKRLKNYADPNDVFNESGADALRWYLLSSPLMTGGDLAISKDGSDIKKAMRQAILKIWNAYSFFTLYANIDGVEAKIRTGQTHILDRYILAKTGEMIAKIQDSLDHYDIPAAYADVPAFVDALNNWYIRSRRASFWSDSQDQDKQDAYDTLYTVLTLFCRAVAPMMPLISERIYTALTGEPSVHLTDWPDTKTLPQDRKLVDEMDRAREVCSAVLSLREVHRRRTRLPLKKMTIAHAQAEALKPYQDLISEAVNIKEIAFTTDVDAFGKKDIKVNPKLGAALGKKMKEVFDAQRSGAWKINAKNELEIAGIVLEAKDFETRIKTEEGVTAEAFDAWRGVVNLDITVDPDLQKEGWSRDFIRLVQDARKKAGFVVTDTIEIAVMLEGEIKEALELHLEHIAKETLAKRIAFVSAPPSGFEYEVDESIDETKIRFAVKRVP